MPQPSHCIPLLFDSLPICHNIHTTAKKECSHNSLAAQIHLHIHFSVYSTQFHTNKLHYESFTLQKIFPYLTAQLRSRQIKTHTAQKSSQC